MSTPSALPLGKLPPELLARLINLDGQPASVLDRVIVGPGIGLDCAVLDFGDRYLVCKTDPITFATDEIGWYAVQINANDVACSGARPQFFLATVLLPEAAGNSALAERIFAQMKSACASLGAALVGGHTEITYGIERPIVSGTMLGEVARERLITAAGAQMGDSVLLTKGYPIEAISIIAREVKQAADQFEVDFIRRCQGFLRSPGISVVKDAQVALSAGKVSAMHDPTEGGIAAGLWELAEASGRGIEVAISALPLLPEGDRLCRAFTLDPLGCIASGALLLTTPEPEKIRLALEQAGIPAYVIGKVTDGKGVNLPRPARDEIAKLF
ncbi:MAG TPA: AIR synthase family protein [Anaerolineales bacterium]|nr:AIR synthase family protein [Anaerolineales bacterium]